MGKFAFFANFAGVILALTQNVVGRVLLALGIGYITYQGLNTTTDWIFAGLRTNLQSLPVEIAGLLSFLWVDKAVETIISAYSAALLIKMGSGTSLTKQVIKKP